MPLAFLGGGQRGPGESAQKPGNCTKVKSACIIPHSFASGSTHQWLVAIRECSPRIQKSFPQDVGYHCGKHTRLGRSLISLEQVWGNLGPPDFAELQLPLALASMANDQG